MHIHARSKAEQSDVQQSEVSESIDSLNSFLERDYVCHFEHGFAPSCLRYFAASRLYVLAGERMQIRSQPRHNIDQNIPEKSIPKSIRNRSKIDENRFLEPYWLKMTPPWSHLGPRWPRGLSFYRFLTDFGEPKMLQKTMKKWSNFQTPIETLFSAHGAHKRSKMKVQNNSQIWFFLHRAKYRKSCSREHAGVFAQH